MHEQVQLPAAAEGVAIPLIARGQLLGVLAVGRHEHRPHESDEIAVLTELSRRAAFTLDNARIHMERRIVAHILQRPLLPPPLPSIPGIGLYDVIWAAEDRWLFVIGDVSGVGLQAAIVAGLVRENIRALRDQPARRVLSRVNDALIERGRGRYCTLALASVRGVGEGQRRVEAVLHLAGHERPLLLQSNGEGSFVGSGGTALGLLDRIRCPPDTVYLNPGDSLIFYTNGVTQRRRGQQLFGEQRLCATAAPLAGHSAESIAAKLRTVAVSFSSEPPHDDIALLVLRNNGGVSGSSR
jgi:hypothetical protein